MPYTPPAFPMPTILVVEDEADLQAVLEYNLTQAGFQAVLAGDGPSAIEKARECAPDLVLLDLMLPGMEGTAVCRTLKSDSRTERVPIIMLTARTDEIDRVVGFELGADDYVAKPFSVRELLLRIRAVLRRKSSVEGPVPIGPMFEFGYLRIDQDAHRVWVDGEEVVLTHLEFKLLTAVIQQGNRVQSRSNLLSKVWDVHSDVTTRTVDTHVKRLREKLGVARNYIETVRGVGYRFVEAPPSSSNGSGSVRPPPSE